MLIKIKELGWLVGMMWIHLFLPQEANLNDYINFEICTVTHSDSLTANLGQI